MSKKNYLFGGNKTVRAISAKDSESTITVTTANSLDEIRKLVDQRKQAGIQLSKKLIELGLHADDDEETQIG